MQGYWDTHDLHHMGVTCGKDVFVANTCKLVFPARIHIDDGARIDDYCVLMAKGWIRIGRRTNIGPHCFLSAVDQITIGKYVSLASGVKMYTASDDYHGSNLHGMNTPDAYIKETKRPIELEDAVLIGAHAVILGGVTMDEGSACGAFTLVKESVDGPWLVAGVPAKRIRHRGYGWLDQMKELENDNAK